MSSHSFAFYFTFVFRDKIQKRIKFLVRHNWPRGDKNPHVRWNRFSCDRFSPWYRSLNRNLESAQVIILNLCAARYNGLLPARIVMIGSTDANGDSWIFLPYSFFFYDRVVPREAAQLSYRVAAAAVSARVIHERSL